MRSKTQKTLRYRISISGEGKTVGTEIRSDQWLPGAVGGGGGVTAERWEGTFGGGGCSLYFYCSSSYMNRDSCQNSAFF